ncbi:unnamed protein product [Closterium sp. Naga37s-1]|nr:unnamed protein product [Closterium sp. Naga37s-1]
MIQGGAQRSQEELEVWDPCLRARFDPFGPPGTPGFEPGRFGDGRPRPRGPPGGGVHPDMQHFPGSDDFL